MRIALALTFFLTACSPVEEYVVEVDPEIPQEDFKVIQGAAREWEVAGQGGLRLEVLYKLPSFDRDTIWLVQSEHLPAAEGFGREADGYTTRKWVPPVPGEFRSAVVLRPGVGRGVVLHELGHALGLDHSDRPEDVMHVPTLVSELSEGDRSALLSR